MTTGDGDAVAAPEVVEARARWGVEPRYVETLRGGAANEHWRVEGGLRPFVLRRYQPRHTPQDVAYEHAVLDRLAGRSWPVAAPLPALAGGTLAVTGAGAWSLFPRLTGEPPPSDPLSLQRKGALLALLHADLAEIDPGEQRPGFGRVTRTSGPTASPGSAPCSSGTAPATPRGPTRSRRRSSARMRMSGSSDTRTCRSSSSTTSAWATTCCSRVTP